MDAARAGAPAWSSAEEYVLDNAQAYLDLQVGAVVAAVVTILIALLPLAFAVWGAFQRSVVFVIISVIAAGMILWFGLSFSAGLAERGAADIGTKRIEGTVTAVQASGSEVASVGLDSQSRVLLVRYDSDVLTIGDPLALDCLTIDGAIALSTPCRVVDAG